jgi:ribosomal protein S12 methylthiotransferase
VDGLVLVPGVSGAPAGAMFQVYITGAMEYDLVGEPLIEETFSSRKR